jgi:hypothetical protein
MGCWRYLTTSLPSSTNISIALLGYIGLLIMLYRRGKALIVSFLFLGYLVFISSLNLWWTRWALPLIPLVAIGFAIAIQKIYSTLRDQYLLDGWKRISASVVVALIISPLLLSSVNSAFNKFENNDTRVRSLAWVYKNIPKKSKVLLETYAPQLSTDDYEVLIAKNGKLISWKNFQPFSRPNGYFGNFGHELKGLNKKQLESVLAKSGAQYIIMSNFKDRFKREEKTHQAELRIYELIISFSKEIRIFDPTKDNLGVPVRIYQLQ